MRVDMTQERLKKIKLVHVGVMMRKCDKCGNFFKKEPMFRVPRWCINDGSHYWYYCTHCLRTKEQVLMEIETDDCDFGIFPLEPKWLGKPCRELPDANGFADPNVEPG
jgi:hypothetical protein